MTENNLNKTVTNTGYEILTSDTTKIDTSNTGSKMFDTVSVIMTYYNAERFIEQAMLSVLNQITSPEGMDTVGIDFVIVDDKSQDKSTEIVKNIIKVYEENVGNNGHNININLIESEKNLGCGGARKLGIENAKGDYIMFLDADDYYINMDFVARAHYIIKKEDVDIVEFGVRMNTEGQQPVNAVVPQTMKLKNMNDTAEIAMFNDNIIKFNVWSKIYKRDIVMSRPYSDSRVFEDVRTVPYWLKAAKEILIMNTVEVNYRAASGSIIRDNIIDTRIGTITAIAGLFEDFKDNKAVLKAMYTRAMVDITALCDGHSEENDGFIEMSKLNTSMLKYIYPNDWMKLTFNPTVPEFYEKQKEFIDETVKN